jgi:hypothetical protein
MKAPPSSNRTLQNWFIAALTLIGILFLVLGILSIAYLLYEIKSRPEWDVTHLGNVGDLSSGFGAALIAGASTFLVLATLLSQKAEMAEQRNELKLQHQESALRTDRDHMLDIVSRLSSDAMALNSSDHIPSFWNQNLSALKYAIKFAHKCEQLHGCPGEFMEIVMTISRLDGLFSFGGSPFQSNRNDLKTQLEKHPEILEVLLKFPTFAQSNGFKGLGIPVRVP